MIWPSKKGSSGGGAPWWSYWSASITNTIGPAMGIEALKYISYPAQVLKKKQKKRKEKNHLLLIEEINVCDYDNVELNFFYPLLHVELVITVKNSALLFKWEMR